MNSQLPTPPTEISDRDAGPVPTGCVARARAVDHPLGPILVTVRLENPIIGRLYALGLALAAVTILVIAFRLVPSDAHMGTHRQLGLPKCGFVVMTGYPCPTCGMTTAFSFMVHGRIFEALRSHVAGSIMAVATAGMLAISLWSVVTGRYVNLNWYRIDPVRFVWMITVVLVCSWALNIFLGLLDGSLPVR